MHKKNKVVRFLIKENISFNKELKWNFLQGSFDFSNSLVLQNAGSVYGIFIKMNKDDLSKLGKGYCKNAHRIGKYYVLYWGCDVHPGSRIRAHLSSSSSTGAINLLLKKELADKDIIWGCIVVNDYQCFEKHLHQNYPSMLGSIKSGRTGSKVKIQN